MTPFVRNFVIGESLWSATFLSCAYFVGGIHGFDFVILALVKALCSVSAFCVIRKGVIKDGF